MSATKYKINAKVFSFYLSETIIQKLKIIQEHYKSAYVTKAVEISITREYDRIINEPSPADMKQSPTDIIHT